MAKRNYRLIGRLYYEGFKKYKLIDRIDDFFYKIMGVFCTTPTQSDIFQYEYFSSSALSDFKDKLSDQDTFINNLRKCLHLNSDMCLEFNKLLIDIIASVKDYSEYSSRSANCNKNHFKQYDQNERLRLKSYYSAKKESFNLAYNVYLLIYFAVFKRLPVNFYFGTNYEKDLLEFNEKVTCKYGVISKPGIREIINLAEGSNGKEANIFALYEYADMFYYGSENGPSKNINIAFKTYKRISSTSDNSPCHPLAYWSLAYIYYNYHLPKTELEHCDIIEEIESMSRLEQLQEAIRYASFAWNLVKNPAAANILGKICTLTDSDVKGIEKTIKKAELEPAIEYFKKAAAQNYVYAHANLANIYLEEIFLHKEDKEKQNECLEQYLNTLEAQANQHEPWAANKLGLFYLNGIVQSRKTDEEAYEGKKYCSRKKSFYYFSQAITYFNDPHSGWAYANMIINFPEKYIEDKDYTKLKLHLKRLAEIKNISAINYVLNEFLKTYKACGMKTCQALLSILKENQGD